MEHPVYFDVLDTARTALTTCTGEGLRAEECIRTGQAELKLALLRGWTPVFPQTYGWDSAALLSYVEEAGVGGASFKWLVAQGFIRIRLRGAKSIFDAALEAFQKPAFRRLSAWPEFNTDDPLDARRPLVEAMRTGKCPSSLPESARNRLELLRQLSDAAEQAPPSNSESKRGDKLRALIAQVATVAHEVDAGIGDLLRRCTLFPDDLNNRTAIDTFLEEEVRRGVCQIPQVRDITNACFNLIAAECVGAKGIGLTFSPSKDPLSVEILRRALRGSQRAGLFESGSGNHRSSDLTDLDVVGWEKVRDFVKDKRELPLTVKDREAEAAKFIAKVAVEGVQRYVIKTEVAKYSGLFIICAGGSYVAGPEGFIVTAGLAGLIGSLTGIDFGSLEKKRIAENLETKWQGLLQVRCSE